MSIYCSLEPKMNFFEHILSLTWKSVLIKYAQFNKNKVDLSFLPEFRLIFDTKKYDYRYFYYLN